MKHLSMISVVALLIAAAAATCPSPSFVDPELGLNDPYVPQSPAFNPPAPAFLLTQPNELSASYKMDGPDPNPRTSCPWQETPLMLWHDPATWPSSAIPPVRLFANLFYVVME